MQRTRWIVVAAVMGCWLLPAVGVAQPPAEGGSGEQPVDPVPSPPSPMEERMRRLEERDQAQQAELSQALGRVDELERALRAAQAEDAAEDAAEAEAEAQEPAPPTGPTVRPLASLFTRYEHRAGYMALGAGNPGCFPGANDGDCIRYRASAGLAIGDLRVSDDVVAAVRFLPQVAGFWSFGGTSGGVTHPSIDLFEGNLSLQLGRAVRFDIGRIVLNYGDQMVIGALRWHPAGRSFDGARLHIQPEADGYWIDVFWSMLNDGGPGRIAYGDRYFYGVYAALGPLLGAGTQLDAYALGRQSNDNVDAMGMQNEWSLLVHVGGRFRHRIEIVDLRFEGGIQLGRQGGLVGTDASAVLAGHLDAEVGLDLADDRVRLGAHGFFASGDDPSTPEREAYDQLFPTAHAFLGLSDAMGGRSNVAGGALHVLGKPIPEVRLGLDVFVFARPEVLAGAESYAGAEGDVSAVWLPGRGLRVRGLYALFIPNEGLWGTSSDPIHYVEVELGYELQ